MCSDGSKCETSSPPFPFQLVWVAALARASAVSPREAATLLARRRGTSLHPAHARGTHMFSDPVDPCDSIPTVSFSRAVGRARKAATWVGGRGTLCTPVGCCCDRTVLLTFGPLWRNFQARPHKFRQAGDSTVDWHITPGGTVVGGLAVQRCGRCETAASSQHRLESI